MFLAPQKVCRKLQLGIFAFCYTALWTKAFIFAPRFPLIDAVVKNIFPGGEERKKNAEKYEGGNEMNAEGLTF